MSWRLERVYSGDYKGILTDNNHIISNMEAFQEIYEVISTDWNHSEKSTISISHSITRWIDEKTIKNEQGNPLDILLWKKEDILLWLPYIEHTLHTYLLEREGRDFYTFGYIDGRFSHLGPFTSQSNNLSPVSIGYVMWQQVSTNRPLKPIGEYKPDEYNMVGELETISK